MKSAIMTLAACGLVAGASAQFEIGKTTMDVYGYAQLDMGTQTGQNNPDWYDVVRPSQLPVYEHQYGSDGNFYASVRQSRLGFKTATEVGDDELTTIFEFELFGVGADAGQTTFRLRQAYGQYKNFGAGQTWSVFMDPSVFPNSLEYWGPSGMIFYRNIQFRYMPVMTKENNVAISLENPGGGFDEGSIATPPNTASHFPVPDLAAHYRHSQDWGHIQAAGILRYIGTQSTGPGGLDDSYLGWGLNLSGNYKINNDTLRLQLVYGEGIGNYLNDGAPDVGATGPGSAETVPLLGLVAFYDHAWCDTLSTSIGYSMYHVDNTSGQYNTAISSGHYALANLLHQPTPNVMYGLELQYGMRENNSGGAADPSVPAGSKVEDLNDIRLQFSVRLSFGAKYIGGAGGDS
ncbi:DcaP family trimeric outer membrane transporter [Pontiellaceae bacterium B12219]|nr:DcaP family trimeric outer membrane transporter [Pontiellaceae bacterium B12219]